MLKMRAFVAMNLNIDYTEQMILSACKSGLGEIRIGEWLEKAYQDHEVEMYWLKVEPPFEPLRGDPRWQEMLDKVGFPE